jgi:hypothetical protein
LQSLRAGHLALIVLATLREIDDIVKTGRTSGLAMVRSMEEIRSQIDQLVDHERFCSPIGLDRPIYRFFRDSPLAEAGFELSNASFSIWRNIGSWRER